MYKIVVICEKHFDCTEVVDQILNTCSLSTIGPFIVGYHYQSPEVISYLMENQMIRANTSKLHAFVLLPDRAVCK